MIFTVFDAIHIMLRTGFHGKMFFSGDLMKSYGDYVHPVTVFAYLST